MVDALEIHKQNALLERSTFIPISHQLQLIGWSVGDGSIQFREVDGFETRFSGERHTLVLWYLDHPGYLAKVTTLFGCAQVNIATIQLSRTSRGSKALTVIESDAPLSEEALSLIGKLPHTERIIEIRVECPKPDVLSEALS